MKLYFDYLSKLNENKKKPARQVVKESKKLHESTSADLFADMYEQLLWSDARHSTHMYEIDDILEKYSTSDDVFEFVNDLYDAASAEDKGRLMWLAKEAIKELNSKKRMNESTELTTLNDFLDELKKGCGTKQQADALYRQAKETLGKGDFGLFEKEYVQMRNRLSESKKRMNEAFEPCEWRVKYVAKVEKSSSYFNIWGKDDTDKVIRHIRKFIENELPRDYKLVSIELTDVEKTKIDY